VSYVYIFKSAVRFEAQEVILSEKNDAFMKGRPFPFGFVMASVLRELMRILETFRHAGFYFLFVIFFL